VKRAMSDLIGRDEMWTFAGVERVAASAATSTFSLPGIPVRLGTNMKGME